MWIVKGPVLGHRQSGQENTPMSKHRRQQSVSAHAKIPMTQAQRVALLARVAEVILSDSGQADLKTEAQTDIILSPDLLSVPDLDLQQYVTGSSSDGAGQASVKVRSNGDLPSPNLSLPPEAQALRQVTVRQAAEILGVHERTIRRLLQAGELSAVGRGRLTRIALRDIAAYQQRNRR
jgi:excisionase family DNA binding protein